MPTADDHLNQLTDLLLQQADANPRRPRPCVRAVVREGVECMLADRAGLLALLALASGRADGHELAMASGRGPDLALLLAFAELHAALGQAAALQDQVDRLTEQVVEARAAVPFDLLDLHGRG
jgi:hypothetical protein